MLHCGASLSKQWCERERSNNLFGNRFCTTGVAGKCAQGVYTELISDCSDNSAVVSPSHTPFNGKWLHETTSPAARAACLVLSFVLCLFSLCLLFQQDGTLCHVCFYVLFILHCLWGPSWVNMMVPY